MCDDEDELVENIKLSGYSLLCGNGLTKCIYGKNWRNPDENFYKIFLLDILSLLIEKGLHIECSERFFNFIRIEYGLKIFQYYQKLQTEIDNKNPKYIPKDFLKNFKNIYTLNYDVLIPRTNAEHRTHNDGFSREPISALKIQQRYQDKGLYYLHGAFHLLFNHQNKTYRKIIRTINDDLLKVIGFTYRKLKQHLKKPIILKSKTFLDENDPLLVFASRSEYKLGAILTDDYLNNCYEKLKAEKRVVVFGCSFKNDEHILDALMSGDGKEIYICYFDENDLTRFQQKIKNTKNKITVCESKGIYSKLCRC